MTGREAKVICIIGMGRSGTSLIANLINMMGVYFGKSENLLGYEPTEHHRFREINGAILRRFKGYYDKPPAVLLQHDWEYETCLEDLKDEALNLISQEFRDTAIWGWKTPSTTLVLPFWQSILSHMSYVICVRNPIDVAISYKKFRGFPFSKTINLWLLYNILALRHTRNQKRFFVVYDDFVTEANTRLRSLIRFVTSNDISHEAYRDVKSLTRVELHHNKTPIKSVCSSALIPPISKMLYIFLRTISAYESYDEQPYFHNFDETSDILFEIIKENHYERTNSMKSCLISSIESFIKPIIPEEIKHRLITLRDYIVWS